MILINGYAYQTEGLAERPSLQEYSTIKIGLTGKKTKFQAQFVGNERTYTLLVDQYSRRALENQLARLGKFDFVDEAQFTWKVAAGVDDTTHAYSTGAWFQANTKLSFVPQEAKGSLACDASWQVDVTIVIDARGVRTYNPAA